jgi:hypothetical protein
MLDSPAVSFQAAGLGNDYFFSPNGPARKERGPEALRSQAMAALF